jgi:hypothetical protein
MCSTISSSSQPMARLPGMILERGGEVAAIDGFENFSLLDEPKANGFVSRYHRRLVDVREMQRLGFRLPPDCRPR